MQSTPSFSNILVELRPFKADDLSALGSYLNHPELTGRRYIPWKFPKDLPLSDEQIEGVQKKWGEKEKGFVMGIYSHENAAVIGHAEADWGWDPHSPGISLVISPLFQRQGYGGEALKLVLDYLFKHTPAHNVSAWLSDWNEAGRNFAAKYGFTECGEVRRDGIRDGTYFNSVVVDILRPEWKEKFGG